MRPERMELAAMRWPRGMVEDLKRLAGKRSYETGKSVTWSEVVREVMEEWLIEHGEQKEG